MVDGENILAPFGCVCWRCHLWNYALLSLKAYGILLLVYAAVLVCFYFSPKFQQHMTFQHWGKNPVGKHELNSSAAGPENALWDDSFADANGVFIYLHGITGNRALGHRVELYKFLQRENYHVVAFDYRGFGDSSSITPSETGVVTDSMAIYSWIRCQMAKTKKSRRIPMFLWGHSLGAGIALHTEARLSLVPEHGISGIVLESPFSNFGDALERHRLTLLYRWIPGLMTAIRDRMMKNDIAFDSDCHMKYVDVPVLILHAIDDKVIPYELGEKLHRIGLEHKNEANCPKSILFHGFKPENGYGHKYICRSPELPRLIQNFLQSSTEWKSNEVDGSLFENKPRS